MKTKSKVSAGFATLSSPLDGDPPYKIHGVALGAGDVTVGRSRTKKKWPAETLKGSADSLAGKPLVKNHVNHDVDNVVGQVSKAAFKDGTGIVFEGEIGDRDVAQKVGNGWLDVSPRILHEPVSEMEVEGTGDNPTHIVGEIRDIANLAIVPQGASPSNEVDLGESEDLMVADLQDLFGYDKPVEDGDDEEMEDAEGDDDTEVAELKTVAGVTFEDTSGGELDESEIPSDDFESHYLYPGDTKSESSYPVVDAEGNLRAGNVESAFQLGARGGVSKEDLHSKLESLNDEFSDPPIDPEKFDDEEENASGEVDDDNDGQYSILNDVEILGESGTDLTAESVQNIDFLT